VSNPPSAATLLELEAYFANNGLYALNYAAVNQIPRPAFLRRAAHRNAPLTVQFTDMTPHQRTPGLGYERRTA
jgi:PKD repeat protein